MGELNYNEFEMVLKDIRENILKLSLKEFADLTNYSKSHIHRIETESYNWDNKVSKLKEYSVNISNAILKQSKEKNINYKFIVKNRILKLFSTSLHNSKERRQILEDMEVGTDSNFTNFLFTFFSFYFDIEVNQENENNDMFEEIHASDMLSQISELTLVRKQSIAVGFLNNDIDSSDQFYSYENYWRYDYYSNNGDYNTIRLAEIKNTTAESRNFMIHRTYGMHSNNFSDFKLQAFMVIKGEVVELETELLYNKSLDYFNYFDLWVFKINFPHEVHPKFKSKVLIKFAWVNERQITTGNITELTSATAQYMQGIKNFEWGFIDREFSGDSRLKEVDKNKIQTALSIGLKKSTLAEKIMKMGFPTNLVPQEILNEKLFIYKIKDIPKDHYGYILKWKQKTNLDRLEVNCNTPLINAIIKKDTHLAFRLITNGANVSKKGAYAKTPLITAIRNGLEDIVNLLIIKGADLEDKDIHGHTALQWAREEGYENIASELIKHGAKPEEKKNNWCGH